MTPIERPPIANEPLSVVLPVCDQAASLRLALPAWCEYLGTLRRPTDLIIIDDASTDDTAALLASPPAGVTVLRHETRQGIGTAIRTGLAHATHPLLAITTLDHAYPPDDLAKMLGRINEVDLVGGYRAGTPVPMVWQRAGMVWRGLKWLALGISSDPLPGWLGLPAYGYAFRIWFKYGVRMLDIDSGLKLFRRSIFERIPIQSAGSLVHAEILAKANFLECLMDEIPIAREPGPFPPTPWPVEDATHQWTDGWRLFNRPEFGTATSPSPGTTPLA